MTKIFEALEQARRESGETAPGMETPNSGAGNRLSPAYSPQIERHMVGLYQKISSAVASESGKGILIEFIATHFADGASDLIRQFALVAATKLGKSVLLLDANQRDPSQFRYFNLPPIRGWEEAVNTNDLLKECVHRVGDTNCFVSQISPGWGQPIFSMPGVENFFQCVRDRFDLALLDAPAVFSSSDGVALSGKTDGVVLIVESEKTRWQVADNARIMLENEAGPEKILGVILNKKRFIIPNFIYKRI